MVTPTWGETAKGVKIVDGDGNPTGSTDNPLPVTVYSALAQNGINLLLGATAAADAFARLRVSNPVTIFDSQLQYSLSPLLWESSITNNSGSATVTHLPNESAARLTAGANDTVVRQTRGYYRYQPGKSQLIMLISSGYSPVGNVGVNNQPGQVSREIISKLPLSLNIAGTHPTSPLTDSLSIVATSFVGATDVSGEISWRELR